MEGEVHDHDQMNMAVAGGGGGSAAAAATSRWNPTKEQITMLENLYRQGIRTPTAEQIEEVTGRLQAYGHIEGKNVFYWFQNHKARQRQKQKQENNFANYFHRFVHHHHHQVPLQVPPLFPSPQYPPCPNVVCSPYYMPQPELGFYSTHQYPKVFVPPTAMKKRLPSQPDHPRPTNGYTEGGSSYNNSFRTSISSGCKRNIEDQVVERRKSSFDHQETLELFPMHPTGILQERSSTDNSIDSTNCAAMDKEEEEEGCGGSGSGTDQHYFDFLSGN